MNIRKIITDFGSWIFTGLTLLGFLVIYVGIGGRGKYQRPDEINFYFIAVGIVLIIPCIIWFMKIQLMSKKIEEDSAVEIQNLLEFGDRITVNLDNLEILTNSYLQQISVESGSGQRNEYVNVNHNVINLKIPYRDNFINYRLSLDMDPIKLKMHFAIKGETTLYVDKNDLNKNYLDLRFLESR